ncbi:GntR family transcriptional regulator [Acuticoccus sediminis]|uniref:GntR family transcriptional regulator n=1 Tax=Acuticoccus sediminis TaxID=2184697 RepID=A0A8B2NRI9_9HYPH|nr:GntR family transcriptional regulator [Acuticoccus sediminis]RAI01511.1 GntR family transcriptional regulator [Acuticoccus sediminis]
MFADVQPQWSLDPAQPIAPQIHRILRERVILGDLTPGHKISETEIALSYNISRQPVREAFIKLAEEGLMAIRPQRGSIVTKIAFTAVHDARFLREAVESDIVRLLAARADPALVRELRRQIELQRDVASTRPANFIHLDEAFHRTLAEGAGKGGAWRVIQGLKAQMDRVRYLALGQFPLNRLLTQHIAVVDRIEAGDVPGAEGAIRVHLREVLRDLPVIVGSHPELFDGVPDGELPEPLNAPFTGGGNT